MKNKLELFTKGWSTINAINSDKCRREVHHSIYFNIKDYILDIDIEEIVVVLKKNSRASALTFEAMYYVSNVSDKHALFDRKCRPVVKAKQYVEAVIINYFESKNKKFIKNKNNIYLKMNVTSA